MPESITAPVASEPGPAAEDAPAPASPPTHRVVQAIELLSRHPGERLSLARIVRGTGMSRATAHAVLTQLTADGWTVRDADGNYSLGLGLVTIARRADTAFPLRSLALDPMRRLADDHDVPVFLAELERQGPSTGGYTGLDSIVITEIIGNPSVPWIRHARRMPFAPPVCREFIAWAPDSDRRAWLAAADPLHRPRLEAVLDAIKSRGYSVERLADDSAPMLEALAALRHSPVTDPLRHRLSAMIADLITIDYLPDELTDHNAVVSLAAPLFAPDGTVTASLVACPDTNLSAARLESLATATIDAATRVTSALRA
ncbi:helix-turn-helix domain-containing protein [Nocardia sp. CDC153]|uniref:helix-turn-helix domain-containing protein n=1 Tax=Nocardia sp. CDC153 TaxID=3112167 RepID=UPI002DB7A919|nr:helix-turn-helix domain-containing protein [Nocardia sp. CDC153]MEC3958370.1 helix-turn-helix domain-containing protein [Nocardia sp. CDC153]